VMLKRNYSVYRLFIHHIIGSSSKEPFLSHSLPLKIMLDLSISSWIRSSGFHFFGFWNTNFFLQFKVISLASNPQCGGPGLCIYDPQWQGGPDTPRIWVPFSLPYMNCGAMVEVL
jgi:hypothetical protein